MADRDFFCKTVQEMTPEAWKSLAELLRQRGFVTDGPVVAVAEEPVVTRKSRMSKPEKEMLHDFEKMGHVEKEK